MASTTPPRLAEYGTPGPGKIRVTVRGDVAHPGGYWVRQGATLVSLEDVLVIRGDVRRLSVTMIRQREGRPKLRGTWMLDSLPEKSPVTVLADGDVLRYDDVALFTLLARCPETAASRVEAVLDEADVPWRLTLHGRDWRGFSVRFDQQEMAAEMLKRDAQLHDYTVEFYRSGEPGGYRQRRGGAGVPY